MMRRGIDISHWQGPIDWGQVAASGVTFAIISGGDGTYSDPTTETNVNGAHAAGLHVECYHFMRFANSPAQAIAQCKNLWARTGGKASRLWLDMEDTAIPMNMVRIAARVSWLKDVQLGLVGIPLGIYTGGWWWRPNMGDSQEFNMYPLWTAEYDESPSLYGGWEDWTIWQYSSSGSVPGIAGDVDLDYAKEEESDMTDAQLTTLIGSLSDGQYVSDGYIIWRVSRLGDVPILQRVDNSVWASHSSAIAPTPIPMALAAYLPRGADID